MKPNQDALQRAHDVLHALVAGEIGLPMDGVTRKSAQAAHDTLAWVLGFPCGAAFAESVERVYMVQPFVPWRCEKCGLYHHRLFPDEGCEFCKGENISRRMGLERSGS